MSAVENEAICILKRREIETETKALIVYLEFLDLGVPEAVQQMDFSVTWSSKFPLLFKLLRVGFFVICKYES